MTIYISTIANMDLLNSQSMLNILQREVAEIKKMYVYTDPYNAAYLIRWELNDSDFGFVKEDF